MLLADVIDATEAERIGLVNRSSRTTSSADDGRRDRDPAREHGRRSRWRRRSACSNQSFAVSMAEAIEAENTAQALMSTTNDTGEAILAFFERREPRFTGS